MPMYSIDLGALRIYFATALVSVPAYGADRDWLVEEWRDMPQELHIDQSEGAVTITGLTGFGAEKGPHLIHLIDPPVRTERELMAYFLKKLKFLGFRRRA